MVERCALSGSDLKIKFRTRLLTSVPYITVVAEYYSKMYHSKWPITIQKIPRYHTLPWWLNTAVKCIREADYHSKILCITVGAEYRGSMYPSGRLPSKNDIHCCIVVFFILTDRASTIPSNIRGCESGTWSQRGTKVNGSHHGDNPLLRPTGIQIATKSYATLQAMAPTNNKTAHQTSFTPCREQPLSTRIVVAYPRPAFSATNRTNTFQPVLINNSKFLKATHRKIIRKIEIPRSMVVKALSW